MNVDATLRNDMISFADQWLGQYNINHKSGGDELVPQYCPYCKGGSSGHDTRTFALSLEKGVFVCKRGSCGVHGIFPTLVKDISGEEYKNIPVKSSAAKKKDTLAYDLPQTELNPPTEQIYTYFQKRGISKETVDYFKICSDTDGMIVFRFWDENGDEVYHKFRRPWKPTAEELKQKGKEWCVKNTKPILFNMNNIDPSKPVVICEGMVDAMAIHEAGITNVVSVPSGCSNFQWVELNWTFLESVKEFILFGDNDPPGREMVQNLVSRLGEARCRIVDQYPANPRNPAVQCKDADEILVLCGSFEIIDMVENADEVEIQGLIDIGDVKPVDPTAVPRIPTNMPTLDECMGGLMEGCVTIMGGTSGSGKTTLSQQFLLTAIENGVKCCLYSGEMGRSKILEWLGLQAAGSEWVGLKYDKIKKKDVPFVRPDVLARVQDWMRGKLKIYDNEIMHGKPTFESILDIFQVAARRYDCKIFCVDNLMSALCEEEEELKAQTRFINDLKKFAVRYRVHVIVVAHTRKERADTQISKSSIAGSANITNLADNVIAVDRGGLTLLKVRDSGEMKAVSCAFCPDTHRLYECTGRDLNTFSWDRKGLPPVNPRADSRPEYGVQIAEPKLSNPF